MNCLVRLTGRYVPSAGPLVLLWVAHVIGLVGLFGGTALLADRPVIDKDLAIHYSRAVFFREAAAFPGLAWDPGYLGGYPVGGATNVDNRLGELGVWLLRFLPPGAAWNWTLFVLFAMVPLFVYCTAYWSGGNSGTRFIAAVLGTLLFWSMRKGQLAFLDYGMYGWAIASVVVPGFFVGLQRVLRRPRWLVAVSFALIVTLGALAHCLTAAFLPLMAVIAIARWRSIGVRQILAILGAMTVAAALVYPFARPVILTIGEAESASSLAVYFRSSPSYLLKIASYPDQVAWIGLFLLAVSGVAMRALTREHTELALVAAVVACASLFSFLLPGSGIAQPLRYMMPAAYLALVPASALLQRLFDSLAAPQRVTALMLAALLWAWPLSVWLGAVLGFASYTTEPTVDAQALMEHLRTQTTSASRIMIEDDGDSFGGNHYGRPHLVGLLAHELQRELIGGPHPVTLCRVGSTTFVNGTLLGRRLGEYSDEELREIIAGYNVGTVVAWSEAARERFRGLAFDSTTLAGGFVVFRTGLARGFAEGAPGVTAHARANEIVVKGATSSPTLLRWQYDPRFRVEPPLPLRPFHHPFSTVGFIQVDNGEITEFKLRYRANR